jgi:hypothetical protein
MVRVELRRMSVDLDHARAASGRGDLVAALEAVRLLQGRAVVTRQVLESMLGSQPSVAELPPLVRAVQAVGRVISDQEIDRLESDELRARLRAVLYALDHELQLFLQPAGAELVPVDPDRDVPPGEVTAPERP